MKTSPISIRFDIEKLEFIQEKEKLNSAQKVVDFLLDSFWWQNRLAKQEPGEVKKEAAKPPPEPEKVSSQAAYLAEIKSANSIAEIKQIVATSAKDSDMATWQKEAIKKYGIELSKTFDF